MARKILLADDSVTAQNMGRKILTDAGYDVITVNNGSAALKRVGENKPDLIVLDVYMPGYSGLEVCARLKDAPDTARIPILLTVGKLEPFKPEEAARVRADAYIVKPFEASELLSALTRLEDRMVPQADGTRFSTTVSGIERFSGGDPMMRKPDSEEEESGWKNRLRFPSRKKKEEPEPAPEEDFATTPYRDFKKGKSAASGPFAARAASKQEPGLVPDIPRDITPEELDALSELVAKLDGPIPASENISPLSDQITPEQVAAPIEVKQHESEKKIEAEAAPAAAEVTPAVEAVAETPVAAEPVAEAAPVEAVVESATVAEIPATEEPAPVDQTEEPGFAAAASVPAEVPKHETQEFAVVAAAPETSPVVEPVRMETPAQIEEVAETKTPEVAETPQVEAVVEAAPVAASAPAAAEAETSAPSPEELAEALRLLTPTPANGQTLAEAGAALAEELARGPVVGGRWVAEAVALNAEEAALSLEAEMFKTFAASKETVAAGNNGDAASPAVGHEEEEAAEAAVEAAEAGVSAEAVSHATPAEAQPEAVMAAVATAAVSMEAEERDSKSTPSEDKAQEEEAAEEVAGVTFADAIRNQEEGSSSEQGSGGEDDMAKDAKGKGKSNWHQIHSTPEAAAKSDVVEAAKQSEEAPKAMAAAAAADSSASDAIASIVDSVLADLRPKIVEEIAKKLAKK